MDNKHNKNSKSNFYYKINDNTLFKRFYEET